MLYQAHPTVPYGGLTSVFAASSGGGLTIRPFWTQKQWVELELPTRADLGPKGVTSCTSQHDQLLQSEELRNEGQNKFVWILFTISCVCEGTASESSLIMMFSHQNLAANILMMMMSAAKSCVHSLPPWWKWVGISVCCVSKFQHQELVGQEVCYKMKCLLLH